MEQFFEGICNETEAKAKYKELAKKYHPDVGGCVETMKLINLQYERVLTGVYQKEGKSITEIEELLKRSTGLAEKLCEIIACPSVIVELCGNWIWVTGETREVKETLKGAGFFWASKKGAWYWRSKEDAKTCRGKTLSLEEIRNKHGREVLTKIKEKTKIA